MDDKIIRRGRENKAEGERETMEKVKTYRKNRKE
jgi:hypothetical protein